MSSSWNKLAKKGFTYQLFLLLPSTSENQASAIDDRTMERTYTIKYNARDL